MACFIKFRKDGDYIEPFQKKTIIEYYFANKDFLQKRFVHLTISLVTLYITVFPAMFADSGLPLYDPYIWGSKVYQLFEYNVLDYEMIGAYFASVTVIATYFSIFSVDGITVLAFCKFLPLIFLFIDFLFVVCIIDRIVGPISWSPLILPFVFIIQGIFIYRALALLPPIITTFFICVLFLSFLLDDVPLFMISLFLANIIISHPFNGPIFSILIFGLLILYYLFKKENEKDAENVTVNVIEQVQENEGGKTGEINAMENIRIKYVKDPLFLQGLPFKKKILRVIIMISFIAVIILPSIAHMTINFRLDWIENIIYYLKPSSNALDIENFIGNDIIKQANNESNTSYMFLTVSIKYLFATRNFSVFYIILPLVILTKSITGKQQKMVVLFSKIIVLSLGLLLVLRSFGSSILPETSFIYNVMYGSLISFYFERFYEIMFLPLTILLATGLISLIHHIEKSINDFQSRKVKDERKSNEDQGWKAYVKDNIIIALILAFFIITPGFIGVYVEYRVEGAYDSFVFCYKTTQKSETHLNIGYTNCPFIESYTIYMRNEAHFIAIDQPFNDSLTLFKDRLELNKIDYLWLFFNNTAQTTNPDYLLIVQNIDSIGKVVYNDTRYYIIEVF